MPKNQRVLEEVDECRYPHGNIKLSLALPWVA